mmetsp:Transcript_59821/g.146909  ORF Transcript_59821/g.146909 Transcript_59821/m.146909 type:complete len:221 (-) Transcript_59821:4365-5027(-)
MIFSMSAFAHTSRSRLELNPLMWTISSLGTCAPPSIVAFKKERSLTLLGTPEKNLSRSIPFVFATRSVCDLLVCRRSARPIISSRRLYPKCASISRTSSATNSKKFTTCSGVPGNFLRSSSFWLVTPTGHVLRWQTRAITHPSAIMAMVPKPNCSAPRRAAIITSRPVRTPPSTRRTTRSRRLLLYNAEWASVKPSSHGQPACLMEERGEAPVPPSPPEI